MSSLLIIPLIFLSQLSMRDGLSQNSVFSIAKDEDKNMWFATYDGINKFDGYDFSVYHLEYDSDYVHVSGADPLVFADTDGCIWAYDGGISRYDKATDSFKLCKGLLRGPVFDIAEHPEGSLLLVTGGFLVQVDKLTGSVISGSYPILGNIKARCVDSSYGFVYVGTTDGHILMYEAKGMTLIDDICIDADGREVIDVLMTSGSELWCVVQDGPVLRVNIKTHSVHKYDFKEYVYGMKWAPSHLTLDNHSRLHVWSYLYIFRYDYLTDSFFDISKDFDNFRNFKSLMWDNEGGMWVGTYRIGVLYGHDDSNAFSRLDLGPNLQELIICSITETPDGTLWISTQEDGMIEYDPISSTCKSLPNLDEGVMNVAFDRSRTKAYIGNNRGVSVYDLKKYMLESIMPSDSLNIQAFSFAREDNDRIWVGSLSGLYLLNTVTNQLKKIPGSDNLFTYKVLKGAQNTLWIATSEGLFCTKIEGDSQSGDLVCGSFVRKSDAVDVHDLLTVGPCLYVAARNGLFMLDSTDKWSHYSVDDGLSSNFLNSLESDSSGRIWIASEYGLNCLCPETGVITRYYEEDGTRVDFYTKNSHCAHSDGYLYFGGVGGVCRIDTRAPQPELVSEIPTISSVFANGISQDIHSGKLLLKHSENTLNFKFSVQNYSSKDKSIFYYRLVNADTEWRSSTVSRSVTYPSLRPGRYRFELYSTNKNSVRSPRTVSLDVRILRPWYFSICALMIYVVMFLLLILYVLSEIIKSSTMKAQREIDRIKEMSQAEIDRLKVLNLTGLSLSMVDRNFIISLVNIIEANVSSPLFGVEQLASDMGMSRSNLFLKVREITGDTVSHLIRIVRFNKACQLLSETDKTIEEISQETGYSSGASFSTAFKQEKGMSPTEWRR